MYTKIIKKVSWTNYQDYILADGEAGYDLTTREFKIGNGIDTWAELSIAQSANMNEIYNAESELKESVNPQTDGLARVSYGQKIWEVEAGQQLTLKTDGRKLQSNIVVDIPEPPVAPDNPVPTEIKDEEEMNRLLADESISTGAIYKYVGQTGIYKNGTLYELREEL